MAFVRIFWILALLLFFFILFSSSSPSFLALFSFWILLFRLISPVLHLSLCYQQLRLVLCCLMFSDPLPDSAMRLMTGHGTSQVLSECTTGKITLGRPYVRIFPAADETTDALRHSWHQNRVFKQAMLSNKSKLTGLELVNVNKAERGRCILTFPRRVDWKSRRLGLGTRGWVGFRALGASLRCVETDNGRVLSPTRTRKGGAR